MNNPKVSILICAYNSGDYILSTIKSVLNQSFTDFELLILDNNSKDGTVLNLESFKDERIKLYKSQTNYGPYGGLNYLLEKATGEYIAILDHDDLWTANKLEEQIKVLDNNIEFIGCGTETIMYYESDKNYFNYYLGENNYYTLHSSLLFRNGNYRYDDSILYFADAYFQKIILCKGEKLIYNIEKPLTLHLIKDGLNNLTYSWFYPNLINLKRLKDIHGITLYSILAISYEILRFLFFKLKIPKLFPGFFKFFDRIPYRFVGGKFKNIDDNRELKEGFGM